MYERCCILAGRILSALAGAGTAWVVFALLRRRTHILGAVLGSLAVGFAPAFVVHSRFQTVDVVATFLLALSLYFALKLLPDQEETPPDHYLRWAALAGLFAGLTAGTKYTGAVVILGVYAAIALARRPDWLRLAGVATLAAFLGFVVSTPGALTDSGRFMAGLNYEVAHTAAGHGLVFVGTPSGFLYQLVSLWAGFTLLAFLGGFGALLYAGLRKKPWALVLLAFTIPYYFLIGRAEVKFLRYTFPLYVPLAVGLGWALGQAHRRGGTGRFIVIGGILAVGIQLKTATQYTLWMAQEDPRDEAGRFFKEESKKRPGLTVGVTDDPWFYTPALYPNVAMTRAAWNAPAGKFNLGTLQMLQANDPKVVYFRADQKPDYVTYSTLKSYDLDRLQNAKDLGGDQVLIDQWKEVNARLQRDYKPFGVFGGQPPPRLYREDLEYVHPYVFVWKRKDLP
jgi:hypothetical protein